MDVNECATAIPKIKYEELRVATDNWSDKNVLGKGGFGTVFKGMWKLTAVAIKRIEQRGVGSTEMSKIQMQQSLNELRHLNSCRHDNILPLYGHSMDGLLYNGFCNIKRNFDFVICFLINRRFTLSSVSIDARRIVGTKTF